jgi:hypothetical protein
LIYQWQKNGTNLSNGGNLSGVTTSTLTIKGISVCDAGSYSAIVSNANFGVTSSIATLIVLSPPSLTLQFSGETPLLELNGMLSNNFVVQCKTNLINSNWITILSLTNLLASPYSFLDPTGSGQPERFYRVLMQ